MSAQCQELINVIEKLPWKEDKYRHKLHSICSRICSLPPSLVRYFILTYSKKGDVVFDPFSGKGTVPLEALIQGRIGWGNDISPEAYLLTKAKISKIKPRVFFRYLSSLKNKMGFLKSINHIDSRVKIFYNEETLKQIIELQELLQNKKDKYSVFIKAILIGILHGSASYSLSLKCSHSYSMSPNYVEKYAKKHGLEKPKRDVIECIKNKAKECLSEGVPELKGRSFNFDSRKIKIPPNAVDMIITSPPYFAIQTYAYDNWLRLWFLGYDYKEVSKTLVNTNSEEKYGQFMFESFNEMHRILKPSSKCFIVIGDVKKKKQGKEIIINTANFLINHAKKAGFVVDRIIVDRIPQGKKVFNSSLCSTGISTERILCLHK